MLYVLDNSPFDCSSQHFLPAGPDSWYNLPREGGVSFAPQEPWILNETIRYNIVFGTAFDEERYKKGQ